MNRIYAKLVLSAIAMILYSGFVETSGRAQGVVPPEVTHLLENRFPQTHVGDRNGDATVALTWRSTSIEYHNGDITLRGIDFHGAAWTAQMEVSPVSECQIWTADLENKQRQDLILLSMGTNSSGGWDSELNLLLFDGSGRPLPWQAIGDFSVDEKGVAQIVKRADGSAQILVPVQRGDRSMGHSYAYNLFGVSDGRTSRILLSENGGRWPLMVSPTSALEAEQRVYDLSTSRASSGAKDGGSARAVIERIENPNSMQDEQLILSDKKSIGFPRILMIDRASSGRFIDFSPTQKEIQELKDTGATIQSLGTDCEGGSCQPLVVWAVE